MPWETIDTENFARKLGVDIDTINAKHELIDKIKRARKRHGLTQNDVGRLIGKSQSYIAKIESGLATRNFSFDVLLGILKKLGYNYKITTKQVSEPEILAA